MNLRKSYERTTSKHSGRFLTNASRSSSKDKMMNVREYYEDEQMLHGKKAFTLTINYIININIDHMTVE